jgi:hypothetical protein
MLQASIVPLLGRVCIFVWVAGHDVGDQVVKGPDNAF